MESNPYFLIYAAIFRISIILAGIVAIVLGYKLFCKGVWPKKDERNTSAEIATGPFKFKVKNGAPGIFFAMFGAIIICAMLVNGIPVSIVEISDTQKKITTRGDVDMLKEQMTVRELNEQGVKFEQEGDIQKAFEYYSMAVSTASLPINNLAWIFQKQGLLDDAILLGRVAVKMKPGRSDFIDTLAVALCKNGQKEEALQVITQSKDMSQELTERMKRIKDGFCE